MAPSRVHTELLEDLRDDVVDDYPGPARLPDPRVCSRTAAETDRLLSPPTRYTPENDDLEADGREEDASDAPHEGPTAESSAPGAHVRRVRVGVPTAEDEEVTLRY